MARIEWRLVAIWLLPPMAPEHVARIAAQDGLSDAGQLIVKLSLTVLYCVVWWWCLRSYSESEADRKYRQLWKEVQQCSMPVSLEGKDGLLLWYDEDLRQKQQDDYRAIQKIVATH